MKIWEMVFFWTSFCIFSSRSFDLNPVFNVFSNPLMYYGIFTAFREILYTNCYLYLHQNCSHKLLPTAFTYKSFYSFFFSIFYFFVKNASAKNSSSHKSINEKQFILKVQTNHENEKYFPKNELNNSMILLTHLAFSLTMREVPQSK